MLSAASLLAVAAVGLSLAGSVAVQHRAARAEATAEAAYPPTGRIIEVEGRRVHAHTEGTGPDLVILHGASGNIRDYTMDFVNRLTDRYRVTVFDRPGFGWTDRAPGYGGPYDTRAESPREQARMLRAAAQELGITHPILMGHSYAGTVALAWALEFPDDPAAIVMVSGVSNPWPGSLDPVHYINSSTVGAATVVPLITAFAGPAQAAGVLGRIFEPQHPPADYFNRGAVPLALRRQSLRTNARQITTLRPHVVEMSPHYGKITAPTEIIHGTEDIIVPLSVHSDPLSRQIPGAVLTPLPCIGHMPHHAAPGDVVAAIDRAAARAAERTGATAGLR